MLRRDGVHKAQPAWETAGREPGCKGTRLVTVLPAWGPFGARWCSPYAGWCSPQLCQQPVRLVYASCCRLQPVVSSSALKRQPHTPHTLSGINVALHGAHAR